MGGMPRPRSALALSPKRLQSYPKCAYILQVSFASHTYSINLYTKLCVAIFTSISTCIHMIMVLHIIEQHKVNDTIMLGILRGGKTKLKVPLLLFMQ